MSCMFNGCQHFFKRETSQFTKKEPCLPLTGGITGRPGLQGRLRLTLRRLLLAPVLVPWGQLCDPQRKLVERRDSHGK